MRGWDNVEVAKVMAERINKPVWVANASNLGALGELRLGAGVGMRNGLYIQAGHRIGAGLIVNGQIFTGASGSAGEFGHMTVNPEGAICRCGNRGCLETEAGGTFLLDSLRVSHGVLTLKDLLRLASEGDLGCTRVVSDAGRKIGLAAANLCNVFNPERIIVGGELAAVGPTLLGPIREALARYALPSVSDALTVVQGALGANSELVGAISFALERTAEKETQRSLASIGASDGAVPLPPEPDSMPAPTFSELRTEDQ